MVTPCNFPMMTRCKFPILGENAICEGSSRVSSDLIFDQTIGEELPEPQCTPTLLMDDPTHTCPGRWGAAYVCRRYGMARKKRERSVPMCSDLIS